jgi:adenylate cyclase
MAIEIERKFLVKGNSWRQGATGQRIRQGYVCSFPDRAVRVRIAGDRACLTIKGAQHGASRYEYEYDIPMGDAAEMLERLCERPLIEKMRHHLTVDGREWIVDEFEGENTGLMVAEVEFEKEGQAIALPDWAGAEVTDEPRYLNVNLVRHPYRLWSSDERNRGGHDSAADSCYRGRDGGTGRR